MNESAVYLIYKRETAGAAKLSIRTCDVISKLP